MTRVRCPDCGAMIDLPVDVRSGDIVECPHCAGVLLRLRGDADAWSALLVHWVSCPNCDALVMLPENAKPGDLVTCCGRDYRLTFEYGAFAAEDIARARESIGRCAPDAFDELR